MEFQLLDEATCRAAETLFREVEHTRAALDAFLNAVQGSGQVRRLSPGVWAVVKAPESYNEVVLPQPEGN